MSKSVSLVGFVCLYGVNLGKVVRGWVSIIYKNKIIILVFCIGGNLGLKINK